MIGDRRLGIYIYTGVMVPTDLRILQMVLEVAGIDLPILFVCIVAATSGRQFSFSVV